MPRPRGLVDSLRRTERENCVTANPQLKQLTLHSSTFIVRGAFGTLGGDMVAEQGGVSDGLPICLPARCSLILIEVGWGAYLPGAGVSPGPLQYPDGGDAYLPGAGATSGPLQYSAGEDAYVPYLRCPRPLYSKSYSKMKTFCSPKHFKKTIILIGIRLISLFTTM